MSINRRSLLKAGLVGLPCLGVSSQIRALGRAVGGGSPFAPIGNLGKKRMLTIYLRGGADPLNMLVPYEDPDYYSTLRNNIGVAENTLFKLPNYQSLGLNPNLEQLANISLDNVAYLYRVGNPDGHRSHFTEQHLSETGRTTFGSTDSGWLPQAIKNAAPGSSLGAVSLSKRLQRTFLAANASAERSVHLQTPYSVPASTMGNPYTRDLTIDFGNPGTDTFAIGRAVDLATNLGSPNYAISPDGSYLRETIRSAGTSLGQLRAQLSQFAHDAKYPIAGDPKPTGSSLSAGQIAQPNVSSFFARLEEAVQLLTRTDPNGNPLANVVGVELGGWDSHANQRLSQDAMLSVLDQALKAAFEDLNVSNEPFLIHVVSEFGRTVKDNGTGTDHGVAGMNIALGNTVKGGVYNAFLPSWPSGANPAYVHGALWSPLDDEFNGAMTMHEDALDPATDFRAPLIEIAQKFFGIALTDLPPLLQGEWITIPPLDFLN